MALIQERGSFLLHCPEENGKECALNSEDLLQNKVRLALPSTYPSVPTYSTDRRCEGQGTTALHPLHSQPPLTPLGGYMTEEKPKPILLKNQDRQEVSCPCLITVRELFHIATTYPTFPFSLCSVKIIV